MKKNPGRAKRRAAAKASKKVAAKRRHVASGHPSKVVRIRQDLEHVSSFSAPDATESVVQQMYRDCKEAIREAVERGHPDDGAVYGPLMAATRYAIREAVETNPNLDGEVLARWLCAKLGETLRTVELSEFEEWNRARQARVQNLAATSNPHN